MSRGNDPSSDSDPESPTISNWRARQRRHKQSASNAITRFSGSMTFVVLHAIWFAIWIVLNLVLRDPFDPFPFGLLTLIVSLEAIFLSTFVLISQNQQSGQDQQREDQDFQTNVYSEVLAELIADKLGVSLAEIEQRYRDRMTQANAETGRPDMAAA